MLSQWESVGAHDRGWGFFDTRLENQLVLFTVTELQITLDNIFQLTLHNES